VTELLQFTIFGLVLGCVYAIAAMGLVLTYTVTGVFNFAHGAVGMLAAFFYFELRVHHGWPAPLAIALVVFVGAPIAGALAERMLRPFQGADWATSLVVTIALTVGVLGVALRVFPPGEARHLPYLFGNHRIVVLHVPITYDRIAQAIVAAGVAVGLRGLLFNTLLGARMRANVDDKELVALSGVRSTFVARISWMIGFALAAAGGILFAGGQSLSAIVLTLLVLNAYGAAMVGRLTNFPMTVVGALALGLIQELTNVSWLWPDGEFFLRLRLVVPGVFLIVAVIFVPSLRLTVGRAVGRDEPRVPTLLRSVFFGGATVLATAAVVHAVPGGSRVYVVTALVVATIALSLVALTGLSGQVSLAQYMFLGLGAYVAGKIGHGDTIAGMLLGGLLTAAVGAVIALPAVRLRGLHLALSTFGFALVARDIVLGDPRVFGLSGLHIGRPHVFGISTNSDAAFAVWCAVMFAVLAVVVGVVRRSWFGRQLTAIRDSELAAATLGLPVRHVKVVIFAFSGFLAGCAGALYGGMAGAVQGSQFDPVNGLVILLFAAVGGITTVAGALIAGSLFAFLNYAQATFPSISGVVFVGVAVAAISLGRQPNGLAGVLFDALRAIRGSVGRAPVPEARPVTL
jgi:branched-chain amino acid transport system permease protein